jgi:hypothetical protein
MYIRMYNIGLLRTGCHGAAHFVEPVRALFPEGPRQHDFDCTAPCVGAVGEEVCAQTKRLVWLV